MNWKPLLQETIAGWTRDKASQMAAALAFYSVFSVGPLVLVTIATFGLVVGRHEAQGEIMQQVSEVVGPDNARVVHNIVRSLAHPASSTTATVVGIVVLLVAATGVFTAVRGALNTIFQATAPRHHPVHALLRDRLAAFVMVLGVGFLLLLSLVASAALSTFAAYLNSELRVPIFRLQTTNFLVSLAVVTLLFAMLYRFLPEVTLPWRDICTGAAVTSVLFTVGKTLIGWFMGRFMAASAYGPVGSIIVFLLWIYYSAQIFLMGAEFTRAYAGQRAEAERESLAPERTASS